MLPNIYHITHIRNLPSIIRVGGILANNRLQRQQIDYTDIAHASIQDRRAYISVPCSERGTLHDYVPFYFAARSPMLYSLNKGNIKGYTDGQTPILYFVTDIDEILDEEIPFTFTDGHAIMGYSEFYDNWECLEWAIDWEIMEARYWSDTDEDGDRKRRRQAEFLVYECCPWTCIKEIGVINSTMQTKVREILQTVAHQPSVTIQSSWYY
ncbi:MULTISPECIES: DUF4433 domain-containing protein [Spirulina sp. CCY15215]|uniref:type II toxin-antitoxin system toxin DNA ADP-ribosyl transferase DarT n=1 Tax=Spirulina sp. CCY15215 TaxID=2767591 RepID=UPI00194E714E|nr:DUF4433 domain-containing protein [Spirulina major]